VYDIDKAGGFRDLFLYYTFRVTGSVGRVWVRRVSVGSAGFGRLRHEMESVGDVVEAVYVYDVDLAGRGGRRGSSVVEGGGYYVDVTDYIGRATT
jgi:hypothetical protein